MRIEIKRLQHDRRVVEDRIRTAKRLLRATWTRPMADVQYQLLELKLVATELCILRAWLRNKLHLPDRESCERIAMARLAGYRVEAA